MSASVSICVDDSVRAVFGGHLDLYVVFNDHDLCS
jgi:hypothetical protein